MINFKQSIVSSVLMLAAALMTTSASAQPLGGGGFAPESAVAVIVKVPKPWYAPTFLVTSRMRDTMPLYQSLSGLNFKAYSFARSDGQYGGIYLWKDLASANTWFSPAWFERVEQERGTPAQVRYYEVLLAMDNVPGGTTDDKNSPAVVTVVEIPIPAGVSRARLAEGFTAALPTYQAVPGLLRKYFITTAEGRFGGIYLWKDESSAQAWLTQTWHDRVLRDYGAPAAVEWFQTPILLTGKEPNGAWIKGANPS